MPLTPGDRLGAFEILAAIGSGGMGDVYRARDLTLGRDVAIKVVADRLLGGAEDQARFDREARLLAALNHPAIASIYGVEQADGVRGLVLELVEGPTLAERLSRGRLPIAEALAIARQLIDALEAAHAKGIVHRDLKPGNIKVTSSGAVKVLDFGLAKSIGAALSSSDAATVGATLEGTFLGTAAYVSPEQARGEPIDKRTDIWAFGCVLYEMLTGALAFHGRSVPDTLATVLAAKPDWSALPPETPDTIARLLRRCLQPDVARRLHEIADARLDLEDALTPVVSPAARVRPRWRDAIAALVLVAAGAGVGFGWMTGRTAAVAEADPANAMFGVTEPSGDLLYLFVDSVKISPSGRHLALVTNSAEGRSRIWLRAMDDLVPRRLEGTDGATFPFWSPDSRSLGFTVRGELKILDLASQRIRSLVANGSFTGGASWNRDGQIIFGRGVGQGIQSIRATGGEATAVTTVDTAHGELMHLFPQFLPDGRHFIYFTKTVSAGGSGIMLGDLSTKTSTRILTTETHAIHTAPGYLLYGRGADLVAQRFDSARLVPEGDPHVVARRFWSAGNAAAFSASDTGTLAFATQRTPTTELTWVDRSGGRLGTLGESGQWLDVEIGPDARAVAAERMDATTNNGAIWRFELARGVSARITPPDHWNLIPIWSRDGRRLAFTSGRSGIADIYVKHLDGDADDELVVRSGGLDQPNDFAPDDSGLVYTTISSSGSDIWLLPLTGADRTPLPLVKSAANESAARISPDGRWLAYVSNESGRAEIHVRPFRTGSGRWQVSSGGGTQPRWQRDGRALYFLAEDGTLMTVPVAAGATFSPGPPQALPIKTERDFTGGRYTYDVTDLGQRFLVTRNTTAEPTAAVTVMLSWAASIAPTK